MLDIGNASGRLTGWQELCREISALGFDPPPDPPAAAALAVPMAAVAASDDGAAMFFRRLGSILSSNGEVCLRVSDPGDAKDTVSTWQACCERIRAFADLRGFDGARLSICMPAHLMPPQSFSLISDSTLGRGPRYLFLDSLQFENHTDVDIQRRAASVWTFLWRQRGTSRPLMPVYGGIVRSGCPLLSAEVATAVLPPQGLQAPDDSAWAPIGLSLTRFAGEDGRLDETLLGRNLERLLPLADELLDDVVHACPRQRRDAALNRRLAISMTGFGDLVARHGEDPADLSCLRRLSELVSWIRQALQENSAGLAALHQPLPALTASDLTVEWRAGASREAWQTLWRDAVSKSAVRHRNLLVISPYAVLPAEARARRAYADLLPLIGHADAWSFTNPHPLEGWKIDAFRRFHARARAIIQGADANSFVAAGV